MQNESQGLRRLRDRRVEAEVSLQQAKRDTFQTGLSAAQSTVDTLDATIAQMENTEALNRAQAERDHAKAAEDDGNFWFRRFMVSLQVGNGGAVLALLTSLTSADDVGAVAGTLVVPVSVFGFGLVAAGLVPAFLWLARTAAAKSREFENMWPGRLYTNVQGAFAHLAAYAAIGSACLFAAGLVFAIGGLRDLRDAPLPQEPTLERKAPMGGLWEVAFRL